MSAAAALRPLLPTDAPVLAALFRDSILVLAEEDYGEDQREAWASRADDEVAFGKRLAGQLTLVATVDAEPVGFASLEGTDKVAMIFVAPAHARQGVASLLLDALVRLATARGATTLTVDASDTAREFFIARGFVPKVRNMVPMDEQWLGNTTMVRALGPQAGPRP